MSSSLYVALRSGHEHTVTGLDDETDAVVLARVHDDGPRTGFVGR
jgi:hypothetical protein